MAGDEEPQADAELGATVDEALTDEVRRRRARFMQAFLGADRVDGVGRGDGEREDRLRLELGLDGPADPAD